MTDRLRSSPFMHGPQRTDRVMQWLILATLPGLAAQTVFFGWGNLINVFWCATLAVVAEAAVLWLRKRPLAFYLGDWSAVVTGWLLGLSLPPLVPWWTSLVAVIAAIVLAKQLYGGLGFNPFNPAMVGYALVLVSFPVAMTTNWPTPDSFLQHPLSLPQTLHQIFGNRQSATGAGVDAITMATPLDVYKHQIGRHLSQTILENPVFGHFVAYGWEWVNGGFLLGGLFLLYRRIISWHIPAGLLGALILLGAAIGWDPDRSIPLSLHLLAGGTMLGAFFIATDPVTAASSHTGKLVYGAGIGILLYVIRAYGTYPDAVAFAVLLMNFAAPLIDYYTRPRAYGHKAPKRGMGPGN
ncbi:electron transport complex subunit RsxD [Mangrovitalea sediminis]|uniref:electron transport complex subunit RsxD n=1 Tax=Mangrovitalea sediminis TaxID=1982043 RepID=UPI000BE53BC7|nr:electron transport complex subunit RsxD [Mangrovitalea sediminis]